VHSKSFPLDLHKVLCGIIEDAQGLFLQGSSCSLVISQDTTSSNKIKIIENFINSLKKPSLFYLIKDLSQETK
jgi:hypothetical protein